MRAEPVPCDECRSATDDATSAAGATSSASAGAGASAGTGASASAGGSGRSRELEHDPNARNARWAP